MKNLKKILFFAAYCVIAGTALTSCLDSDGNYLTTREMTDVEKAKYLTDISGGYSGMVVHTYQERDGVYRDTVKNVNWEIYQDKTIEVSDLPDAMFWHYMKSGDKVTEAIKNSTEKSNLEFSIASMFINEYTDGSIYSKNFTLDMKNKEHYFDVMLNEGGTEVAHPVTVKFADSSMYGISMGELDLTNKNIVMQLILSGVKVDNTEQTSDNVIWFIGKKR